MQGVKLSLFYSSTSSAALSKTLSLLSPIPIPIPKTSFPLLSNSSLPFPSSLQTLSSPPHFTFLKHQSTTTATKPEPEPGPGRRGIRRRGYRRRRARGRSQKRCSRLLFLLIAPVNNRGRAQCSDPTRSKAEQA
ncbi:hypothetical protein CMV_030767 [Castanea mollissima]|uniref:Uncharacterized protein n=1 Tax=Castanea mollissima TaxID=60419 RepID=A0A8J4Q3Q1_9ROSI|nr:hypothetical protein CMV_030767 [Castanea mollissima]